MSDFQAHRVLSDIQSKIAALDHRLLRALEGNARRDGSLAARRAACELLARVERCDPGDIAAQRWPRDFQLKNAVAPAMTGTSGWASELVATVVADINSSLLGPSVFGQLRQASAASYDQIDGHAVKAVSHSSVASGGFVAEGGAISVGALLVGAVTLQTKKAASIVAVTRELLRGSAANVETSLQQLLSEDLSLAVDTVLLDAVAADAIRPAGLRNGVAGLTPAATGTPTEKAAADIGALVGAIQPASKPTLIAAGRQAASLGAYMPGMPVIVAPTLASGVVICVDANAFANIVVPIDIAASGEPVLHMESAAPLPLVGGTAQPPLLASVAAPQSSMFQTAATAMRCILDINWAMRRTGAVSWMTGVGW